MAEKDDKKKKRSLAAKIFAGILIAANIAVMAGLDVSAYAGAVDPENVPQASVVAMTFQFWLVGALCLTVFSFFFSRIAGVVGVVGMLVAMPSILDYSPLRFPVSVKDEDETFTLMSYNVYDFVSQHDSYPGGINPAVSHILDADADIVCLQECTGFGPSDFVHLTKEQSDSLHLQYPYIFVSGHAQAILSKFPIKHVPTGFVYNGKGTADFSCFRADIRGMTVTIFNIHMQSFDLEKADRQMYKKLMRLQGNEEQIDSMRSHLFDKIELAGIQRANDTRQLIKYIRKYGGPNVIVCGDFNDVPGCYSLRLLREEKFREVYPEVGFGPMITYNSDRFYFRIDHILYRGDLKPAKMVRGHIDASDHYPVEATFIIENK